MLTADELRALLREELAAAGLAPAAEGLGARQAATYCGVSLRTWRSMSAAGRCPRAVALNGRRVWVRAELLAWLKAGGPDRTAWEVLKRERALLRRRRAKRAP